MIMGGVSTTTMTGAGLVDMGMEVTLKEALSGMFGSISLATWIFLLVPQLIMNYKQQSADGISLYFLLVWLIGDISNLSGAIWADLVPTVIALAIYFCIADFVLIGQCLYYNTLNTRRSPSHAHPAHLDHENNAIDEEEPLLSRRRSSSIGLPGSNRRRASNLSALSTNTEGEDALTKILEEEGGEGGSSAWVKNSLSIVMVVLAGAAGWVIAWRSGVWVPTPEGIDGDVGGQEVAVGASILGYFSAVCYLGARIPQIVKNYREKSCEGLSLLFFLLSLMGNLTYGAQILSHSLEREYLITNAPWLIGSLGTMVEDGIIFLQFRIYGDAKKVVVE